MQVERISRPAASLRLPDERTVNDTMFYLPYYRCGHCKNLAPEWAKAATALKGKFKLGALDATVHTVMASRYGIQGFPTIKYFPGGKKSFDSAEEYDGGRTAGDITQWASDKWTVNLPPPEIYQVRSSEWSQFYASKLVLHAAFLLWFITR